MKEFGKRHEAEARERWGQTDAYKEHAERTKGYSDRQWNDLGEGMDCVMAAFAACKDRGEQPDSVEAQRLVKQLQQYITEHCYRCTDEILRGLGQMYVADERFRNNIDRHGAGTAAFVGEAIAACCK